MFQLLPEPHVDFSFQDLLVIKSTWTALLSSPYRQRVHKCLPFDGLQASFSQLPSNLVHPMLWRSMLHN